MPISSTDAHGAAQSRDRRATHDPVLTSKVTQPDLPGWAVTRPRVEKLIAEGARGPLTSVTGPPGAGKTMAIAAWAASTGYPCTLAWLNVDDYDNRPRAFWSSVVTALRRAGVAVPRVAPGPDRTTVDHMFLVRLASMLAAQDPPVVLVLDDLHLLTEPGILEGLGYVLRNAKSGLHLIVASRADPLLPLHRYRLAGQLAEIRADDLAFSVQESGLLLAHHGVTLPPPVLERITGRTEGWAAGMRLAALSLQGRPDPEQFVKGLQTGDSAITSYLVEEVLNAQPASVRDMLLRTSILDSVSADLAGELTDDPKAAEVLPALARANAFVRPLGHGWYRYHSLFGAVLRLKLRTERRAQVPDLYQRAARWCQRNGRLGEAVRYAAESGDWPFAARMVVDEFAMGHLIESRGRQPLAETFSRMPRDLLAWVKLQQGDPAEAHTQLKLAEAALRTCPDKLVDALACAAAAHRRLAVGQTPAALELIRRAGQDWSPTPPRWLELRLTILESRARAAAGDVPAAVAAARHAPAGPDAAAALAHAWLAAGNEQAARNALDAAHPESEHLGLALAGARLSYVAGDGARGRRCLERALRLAKPEQVRLPFAMERAWLRPVLRRDPELVQAYRELLEPNVITPGSASADRLLPADGAAPLVVERLSTREREVLAHASGMLSTAEIAAEMCLSVNTVKTHLRSIYRKLSATHRSEAVRRARQLELI